MLTPEQIGIQTDLRKAAILSNFKEFNMQAPVSEVIQPADATIEIQKSEEINPIQIIEDKLNDNFSKGFVTEDDFKKASEQLDILKAKMNTKKDESCDSDNDEDDEMYKANKGQDKVKKVMDEYKSGKLKSSSGDPVNDRKQAIAIALSEAGLSKKDK